MSIITNKSVNLYKTLRGKDLEYIAIILVGLSFIIPGLWMYYKPPQKINQKAGYRTNRSMKSQEAWDFANKYSGAKMTQSGIALMLGSALIHFLFQDLEWVFVASLVIGSILVAAYVLVFTERELKAKFPDEPKN